MRAFYSDRYVIALPEHHQFPIIKYAMIRQRLDREGTLAPDQISEPKPAGRDEILLVHTPDYYDRLVEGRLSEREIRRLGLPWSEALVGRSRLSVAGTRATTVTLIRGFVSCVRGSRRRLLRAERHRRGDSRAARGIPDSTRSNHRPRRASRQRHSGDLSG